MASVKRGENRKLGGASRSSLKRLSGGSIADIEELKAKRTSQKLTQNTPGSAGSHKSASSRFLKNRDNRASQSVGSTKQSSRKSRVSLSLDSADGSIARRTRSSQGGKSRNDSTYRELHDDSLQSSKENNGPVSGGQEARRRGRASLGSITSSQDTDLSATGLQASMEVDNLSEMGSRSSRVHFSPQLITRSIPKDSQNNSGNFDEDLSPIRMEGSPAMVNRTGGGHLLASGEKTCGSTPPSILRGATMSATASPDAAGENSVSQILDSNFADDGDETKIASSETRFAGRQRRSGSSRKSISTKKRSSPVQVRQHPKKKQKTTIPTQIKVTRNKMTSQVKRGVSRVLRPTSRVGAVVTNNADSLDFDDEVVGSRSSKKTTSESARNKSKKTVDKVASGGKRNLRAPNKKATPVNKPRKRRPQKS